MRILRFWKWGMAILLVASGLVAYKTTADAPVPAPNETQSCSKEKECVVDKPAISTGTEGSIIWNSLSDNLLSVHF